MSATKWHHFNIITIIPSYLKGIDSNLKIYECSCYITWHNIYICTIHTPFLSFLIYFFEIGSHDIALTGLEIAGKTGWL